MTLANSNRAALLAIMVGMAWTMGCAPADKATAPVVSAPACETNNTASIKYENRSNTNATYDIIWDGSKVTTITPGSLSPAYNVAAGIQHTLLFKFTNTNTAACNQSTPTLAQCSSHVYWCTS